MKKKLYNVFLIIFSIFFLIIFLGTVFDNKSVVMNISPMIILFAFLLLFIFIYFLYHFFISKLDNIDYKKEIIIVSLLLILFVVVQMLVFYYVKAYPRVDWYNIFTAARRYVIGEKQTLKNIYFKIYPNNHAMLYLEIFIFRILSLFKVPLSTSNCFYATVVANIIFINISLILMYFTIRSLFGKSKAILSLIIALMSCGFFIYTPVFYTDTTTMLFPIFILFCYTLWQKKHDNNSKWDYIFILVAFVSIFGIKLKFTVIIMLIAVLIDIIMRYPLKIFIKPLLIVLICFSTFYFSYGLVEKKVNIFPFDISNNNKKFPYVHWIMMGMTEYKSKTLTEEKNYIGWYNPESIRYTQSYKYTELQKKAAIKKIKEQYKSYGFAKYVDFLYRKMIYTWSDATYFAPALHRKELLIEKSVVSNFYTFGGKYFNSMVIINTALILVLYIMLVIGAIKALIKKENTFNVGFMALFGMLLFLLIWESNPRYLINYLPIIITAAMYAFDKFSFNKLSKNYKKGKK